MVEKLHFVWCAISGTTELGRIHAWCKPPNNPSCAERIIEITLMAVENKTSNIREILIISWNVGGR